MLTLADGGRTLASVGAFASAAGPTPAVALQSLTGDLDAVELEAWRDLTRILAHEMMNSLTPICSLAEVCWPRLGADRRRAALGEAVEVIGRRSAGLMSFVERYRRLAELPAPERDAIDAAGFVGRPGRPDRRARRRSSGVPFESAVEPDGPRPSSPTRT